MGKIFTNCDMGECLTPDPDAKIMPFIDMASIACGGHAGDDESMIKTIKLAKDNQVMIGAHPSYADQNNFGRVSHQLTAAELYELIYTQVFHFQKLCHDNAAVLEYIKPHGALYHDMMKNPEVLGVICQAIRTIDKNLKLVVQAGDKNFGKNENIVFLHEVFADRAYRGSEMISRNEKGAVLDSSTTIIAQYQQFLAEKSFKIDTICFHSDNKTSVEALERLQNA